MTRRRPSKRIDARVARVYVVPLTGVEVALVRRAVRRLAASEGEWRPDRAVLEMLEAPLETRSR